MFKRIFLMILVATVLLGCNKETTLTASVDSNFIAFDSPTTRAGLSDVQKDGFGVWACVSSIGSADVSYQPLLTNRKVTLQDGLWNYGDPERWISNSMFYFFAAYPYDAGFQEYRMEESDTKYTLYSSEIVANGSDDTKDILVATNITNTAVPNYSTTVPLTFEHLLTKVNVKVAQNFGADPDFNYYVTGVTIRKVKTNDYDAEMGAIYGNGSYFCLPYNGQNIRGWDFENATQTILKKEYHTPMILRNVGAADPTVILSVWGDGLMLIPQEIAAQTVEIVIDYIYDVSVDDDYTDGTPKQAKGILPATEWEPGKIINYTLSISNTTIITIDQPTIESWGSPQTGGTIIIK